MNKRNSNKYWSDVYLPELQKAYFDSEAKADSKVYAVSAGAIGVLISVLAKSGFVTSLVGKIYAAFAGLCFIVSILLNIIFHYEAMKRNDKQENAILHSLNDDNDEELSAEIRRDNNHLKKYLLWELIVMIAGLVSMLAFIFIEIL